MTDYSWARSWEVFLAVVLLLVAPWLPPGHHALALADAALLLGVTVLGCGLLRDLWSLFVTRPARGEPEAAMCVESLTGVATIGGGLFLMVAAFLYPLQLGALNTGHPLSYGAFARLFAAMLIFASWQHDLVLVKRKGRVRLLRQADHGSFVVHFLRGQACKL
jgi:hypothetical protein